MKKTIVCGLILVSLFMTGCSDVQKKKDVGDWKEIESACREISNEYNLNEEEYIDLRPEKYKVVFGEKKTYDNTFLLEEFFFKYSKSDGILQDLCIDICENNLMGFETDGLKATIDYDEKGRLKECLWYTYTEGEKPYLSEKVECTYEDGGKYLQANYCHNYEGDENWSKYEYVLEDNRPQSYKLYNSRGELTDEATYEYDEQNRLIKEEYSNKYNTVVEYHYSDDGKRKRIHVTDSEGRQKEEVLEYDDEGRLQKKALKDGDGGMREVKLQYNDDHSVIRGIRYKGEEETGWYKFRCR